MGAVTQKRAIGGRTTEKGGEKWFITLSIGFEEHILGLILLLSILKNSNV